MTSQPQRKNPDVCPFHDYCFDQQSQRWTEHKEEHDAMWKKIDAKVQWKVFVVMLTAAVSILGAGFLWFGVGQVKLSDALQSASSNQAVMLYKLEQIEKRMEKTQ